MNTMLKNREENKSYLILNINENPKRQTGEQEFGNEATRSTDR